MILPTTSSWLQPNRWAPAFGRAFARSAAIVALLCTACGPSTPTRGPVPRRPAGEGDVSVVPPPRPQYGVAGSRRVAAKPGVDVTRAPLTDRITPETDADEVTALRLAEKARGELDEGTTTQAFLLLEAAIDHAPDAVEPYVIRAQAHLIEGSASAARDDLQKAVDREPTPAWLAETVAIQGATFELEGDLDSATTLYRRSLSISSANVTARDALRRLSTP